MTKIWLAPLLKLCDGWPECAMQLNRERDFALAQTKIEHLEAANSMLDSAKVCDSSSDRII